MTAAMETYLADCKHGRFLLLRGDFISDCMGIYGEWAEREVNLFNLLLKPGEVVVEVGSNIGTHSVPIAKRIGAQGKLFCIEAQRIVSQLLAANIALNNITNARVFCSIAFEGSGAAFLKEENFTGVKNLGAYNVGVNQVKEGGERTAVISVDSLVSSYGLKQVDLLKIDVEGLEGSVLSGSNSLIKTFNPYIFFECGTWQGEAAHAAGDGLNETLRGFGYKLYWYCCLGFNPENFRKVAENRVGDFGDINILAVPEGRKSPLPLKEVDSVSEIKRGPIPWV